ncbi:MAG: N-acetyltransferase [Nitrospirales bacterium]|nr:MAG: N-acetyltransferase [Nitrospirales bacterium]
MIDFASTVQLENDRLLLRPWTSDDADELVSIATAPSIWRFTTGKIESVADVEQYIAQALADRERKVRYSFVLQDKVSNKLVGSSSLGNISIKDRRVEIGWTWIVPARQGTGVNTHTKFLMLEYCFERMNVHRVEFKTDNANPRSCGALRKIGARPDGVLRSHTIMHDGRYRDTAYYSILEAEWLQLKAELKAVIEADMS